MIALELNVHRQMPVEALDDARIADVINAALTSEGAGGEWAIAVVFVTDAEIQRMHRDFMGIDEPTDIMTFPTDLEMDGVNGGDLVISVDRATAQGIEHGNAPAAEIEFLIVHGILHLLGWNDGDLAARAEMLQRQTDILAAMR